MALSFFNHRNALDRTYGGAQTATFAVIQIMLIKNFTLKHLLSRREDTTFRTDSRARRASDTFGVINTWPTNSPIAGFIFFGRAGINGDIDFHI
jgi:hypothetical protein